MRSPVADFMLQQRVRFRWGWAPLPYSIAVGDFNHDGVADMAVVNQGDSTVSVLLGNGSGGFTAATGSPFPGGFFAEGSSGRRLQWRRQFRSGDRGAGVSETRER